MATYVSPYAEQTAKKASGPDNLTGTSTTGSGTTSSQGNTSQNSQGGSSQTGSGTNYNNTQTSNTGKSTQISKGTTDSTTNSSQTTKSSTQNMDPASMAALQSLIAQLLGGGTPEMQKQLADRNQEISSVRGQREGYSKGAAFTDAQGLMAQAMQQTLEKLMPSINQGAIGSGASQSSMRALLTQKAAENAAMNASAQGLGAAVSYGNVSNGMTNALVQLMSQEDPVSRALINALSIAKGAVQNSTSTTTGMSNTRGTNTSMTEGVTTNNGTSNSVGGMTSQQDGTNYNNMTGSTSSSGQTSSQEDKKLGYAAQGGGAANKSGIVTYNGSDVRDESAPARGNNSTSSFLRELYGNSNMYDNVVF